MSPPSLSPVLAGSEPAGTVPAGPLVLDCTLSIAYRQAQCHPPNGTSGGARRLLIRYLNLPGRAICPSIRCGCPAFGRALSSSAKSAQRLAPWGVLFHKNIILSSARTVEHARYSSARRAHRGHILLRPAGSTT